MPLNIKQCSHLENFEKKAAKIYQCDTCVETGDSWVHLRTCQTCGTTLCCDASINKHARKHFEETGHPVILSAEPTDNWAYCYIDNTYKKIR